MTTLQADRHRVIKFRAIPINGVPFEYGSLDITVSGLYYIRVNSIQAGGFGASLAIRVDPETVGQFTGLLDKNEKEIYEHDIKRETIEYDDGDEVMYFVCVWIKEWAMFAWLAPDEYHDYINGGGVESLDMTMFCTYPAGADEPKMDITICGNIYQNSNLLQG